MTINKYDYMFKKALLILTLLFINLSYAQDCNLEEEYIDKFTKKSIKKTKIYTLASKHLGNDIVRIEGLKIDNNDYLQVYLVNLNIFRVKEGDVFMLLDKAGNITELKFLKSEVAQNRYTSIGGDVYWSIITQFPLSTELKNKLQTTTFTDIRYYTASGYREYSIKKKFSKNLNKSLICI